MAWHGWQLSKLSTYLLSFWPNFQKTKTELWPPFSEQTAKRTNANEPPQLAAAQLKKIGLTLSLSLSLSLSFSLSLVITSACLQGLDDTENEEKKNF